MNNTSENSEKFPKYSLCKVLRNKWNRAVPNLEQRKSLFPCFSFFFLFFNQVGEPHVWRRDMLYNGDLNFVYYIMFETLISGNKVRVKPRMIYDCQRKEFITRKIEWIRGKQKILTLGYNQTAYPLINSTLKNKKQFDEFDAIYSNIIVFHSSARLMAFN